MQFPKFTQRPLEPIHPGICLQQELKHLLRFCLTCVSKTLLTGLYVTKDRREGKLEHMHTSPLPPFPCKCKDLNSSAHLHKQNRQGSLPVLSPLRRIIYHGSAAWNTEFKHYLITTQPHWLEITGGGVLVLPPRWELGFLIISFPLFQSN